MFINTAGLSVRKHQTLPGLDLFFLIHGSLWAVTFKQFKQFKNTLHKHFAQNAFYSIDDALSNQGGVQINK